MEKIFADWKKFEDSVNLLQERHKTYKRKILELEEIQHTLSREIQAETQLLGDITSNVNRLCAVVDLKLPDSKTLPPPEGATQQLESLKEQIKDKERLLEEVKLWLPKKNAWILNAHLGSIKASFLKKEDKVAYKEEYERFKYVFTIVSLVFAFTNLFIVNSRITDALYHFLLVWYYCTTTLREHVLRTNGSKIMPWWLVHHYLTIVVSGVLLMWPEGWSYTEYRRYFLYFSLYLGFVQLLQYYYQRGHLYRLRALGASSNSQMRITVEGFQGWMWRGLTFIIPFLLVIYSLELYNAYILYHLSFHPKCSEWQVPVVGLLFFFLGSGNYMALFRVMWKKFRTNKDFGLITKYKAV
ncbi:transmembrane protein 120A-like isoform X2 [Convolutriloba macropyga]|uniref:transmembrane protein 120A-like isoform X2 n=1 Tax=Convolutriloba macropyga TaxID=536237 RepID=UPI003F51DF8E